LRVCEDLYHCIRIRACSSYRWARLDSRWSRRCPIKSERRWKELWPVRCNLPCRCVGSAIFVVSSDAKCGIHSGGERNVRALDALPASALVIFLLSGGGSSIVEKPIDDEISLEDLITTYRALVLSGAPIAEINAVRKHLSAVKGDVRRRLRFRAAGIAACVRRSRQHARRARFRSDHARSTSARIVTASRRSTNC